MVGINRLSRHKACFGGCYVERDRLAPTQSPATDIILLGLIRDLYCFSQASDMQL